MTEERKEILRQLLDEAMENLEIRPYVLGFNGLSITLNQYKWHLRQAWTSYSKNSLWIVNHFTPSISRNIKSKLLDFIRTEMSPFICNDKTLSPAFFILSSLSILEFASIKGPGSADGTDLNALLNQLLKIAIFRGIEGAVSDFARCTKCIGGSFQTVTLLDGLTLEARVEVFEGIRLIPVPNSEWELPHYYRGLSNVNHGKFLKKTLLVIDYSVFPVFHKPFPPLTTEHGWIERWEEQKERFHVKRKGGTFPDFDKLDFHTEFCRALSLVCNSAIQIAMVWNYIAEGELFKLNHRASTISPQIRSGNSTEVGKMQVDKAKCLYNKLVDPNSNLAEKLKIPINRWRQSKTSRTPEDKIIDLGIAFESLYLSDRDEKSELSFQLRLRASWFLGKNKKAYREELMKDFSKIYDWRSKVVHTGKLPNKTKRTPFTRQEIEEFITKSQDLCRDSIMKILEEEKFPDWNNLILG